MRSSYWARGLAIAAGIALGAGVVGAQAPNMADAHVQMMMKGEGIQ